MDVVQGGVEHGGGGYTGYVTMQIANYVIKLITSPQPSAARLPRVTRILSDTEGGHYTLHWRGNCFYSMTVS